ncbi:hypothetical protein [Actinoplanes awajinensis]|uniref:DUF732 domain-containing protein n=1 Tax=Actinoplanes awajinensis subsp. mycoplanecinus TaxID=135947 RepID=A0A101JII4_9ACTN|nr:hypothetical protein [Actinoplanes awajinensis]KUL27392.1 hypothetical protein ADL15_35505 [Actinoplanes awajinensis subsp. mycoplanecinus]
MIPGRFARTASLAALLLTPLAGCSAPDPVWVQGRSLSSPAADPLPVSASPAPTAADPLPVSALPASTAAGPGRFVASVRQQLPELAVDRRDEEIADLGVAACASLRDGRQTVLTAYGVSPAQAHQLITVAHTDLCP